MDCNRVVSPWLTIKLPGILESTRITAAVFHGSAAVNVESTANFYFGSVLEKNRAGAIPIPRARPVHVKICDRVQGLGSSACYIECRAVHDRINRNGLKGSPAPIEGCGVRSVTNLDPI